MLAPLSLLGSSEDRFDVIGALTELLSNISLLIHHCFVLNTNVEIVFRGYVYFGCLPRFIGSDGGFAPSSWWPGGHYCRMYH